MLRPKVFKGLAKGHVFGTWWSLNLKTQGFLENPRKVCECDVHVFFHLVFASHSLHIVKYLRVQMRGRGKYTRVRAPGYWLQPPACYWQGGVWHSRAILAMRQGGVSLQSQKEPDSLASQWLQYDFKPGKMLDTLRNQVTLFQCTGPGSVPGIGFLGFYFNLKCSLSCSYFLYLVLTSANF